MKRNLVSSIFVILLTVVFVSCLCPVLSFADSASVTFSFTFSSSYSYSSYEYGYVDSSSSRIPLVSGQGHIPDTISLDLDNPDVVCFYVYQRISYYQNGWKYGSVSLKYGSLALSVSSFTPRIIDVLDPTFSSNGYTNDGTIFYFSFDVPVTPTPTPSPTPTPTPTPSPTPSVEDYFMPFRSFSGAYFNKERLYFPDSVTRNHYEQYSGVVCNHDMRILGVESSVGYEDDKVKYLFQYEIQVLETDIYTFDFLYDSDTVLELKSISYFYDGDIYPNAAVIDHDIISGTHTVYGAYDIDPTAVSGPVYYHWDYNLSNQKCFSCTGGFNFTAGEEIVIFVIVQSDYMPSGSPTFNWSQFFNDTKPDTVFLTVMGGLSSLPFFVSGLSFLALGALIGIILKFMR